MKDLPQDRPLTLDEAFAEEHREFLPDQTITQDFVEETPASISVALDSTVEEADDLSDSPVIYSIRDYQRADDFSPEPSN